MSKFRFAIRGALFGCLLAAAAAPARAADEDLSLHEQDAFKAAVDRVAPSVVKIETIGGLEHIGSLLIGTGPTTGLAVSPDGYIISSAFNFVQKPAETLIQLDDKTRLPATIVATDHSRMLVLLKVKMPSGRQLAVPTAVPKSEMAVGQWSLALGRTYDNGKPSLSVGIISALNRVWSKAIQTDAKVSPNNYGGPLVDIRGRVLGVLVPMSPMANNELAGVEWYDSGIGFAVPLEDINRVLPRLEKGEDLRAGLLGISMKRGDMFADPAEIAAVQPKSPAYQAGFKAKDTVVEIDGHPVATQVQLKHLLGPHYGGDKVRIVVLRGKDRIEKTVELVDKLSTYAHPFLGILPMRPLADKAAGGEPGVVVRYVYPDSPAAKAGVKPGDRLTGIGGKPVVNLEEALAELASFSAHEKSHVTFHRGDETHEFDIQFAALPEATPPELPPAHGEPAAADAKPKVGIVPIRIPESPNKCMAYVPENYNPQVACGVVIWLHAPGSYKEEELAAAWKEICARHDLILLAPKSNDPGRWQRTELTFIRKMLDEVVAKYHVDRNRIVVAGQEGGGAMAYLFAQNNRDWVRGVVAVGAGIPAGSQIAPNDPVERLAYYIARSEKSPAKAQIEASIDALREEKYPVTLLDLGPSPRALSAVEMIELGRWIDSLDRL